MTSEKFAASLVLYNVKGMTPAGKRDIAVWLRKQATALLKDGSNYSPKFTAKYYYPQR